MTTQLSMEGYNPTSGELANYRGEPRFAKADYMARCWVQGAKKYRFADGNERVEPIVGNFHARFQEHPWVREAITEGWDRELRQHVVGVVKFRLLKGEFFTDMRIEDLMPGKVWIDGWKEQARRWREAEAWRKEIEAKYGSMDNYFAKTAHRRQHASVGKAAERVVTSLTERSRAMVGEGA